MICEIISIGTELLLGDIVNTNAQFLSQKLSFLGLDVFYQSVVGDNMERLVNQINLARSRADIIITTGGLGPTDDDITKAGLCNALKVELVLQERLAEKIKSYFEKLDKEMPKINLRQAYIPRNSKTLENNNGSAPGIIYEDKKNIFILLPGPPNEMIPMFDSLVFPYLKEKSHNTIKSRTLKVAGVSESKLQEMLQDIIDKQENPTVALYAKTGEINIRVTAKTENPVEADALINNMMDKIKEILGDTIFGSDNDTMELVVNNLLRKNRKTISVAESCTGGLVSSRLTDIPGASDNLMNSLICYSNDAKARLLGVREDTLKRYGAVSKETAEEMALGIKNISKTDIGLSITGIAGPHGGTPEKPVGLCYIGWAFEDKVYTQKCLFNGSRTKNKFRASTKALDLLRLFLIDLEKK